MLAAWNETEVERSRQHLNHALAEDVVFIDPTIVTTGIDEFERNVRRFRLAFPDARCLRTSNFDTHHRLYRYNWEIKRSNETLVVGFDVVELNEANQVARVLGFFGPLQPLVV